MSDMYAIKGSTLTAIGDAIRGKAGDFLYLDSPISQPYEVTLDTRVAPSYKDVGNRINYYINLDLQEIFGDRYDVLGKTYLECSYEKHLNETYNRMDTHFCFARCAELDKVYSSDTFFTDGSTKPVEDTIIKIGVHADAWPYRQLQVALPHGIELPTDCYYVLNCKIWPLDQAERFIEKKTMTPLEMADAINEMMIIPDEALNITGNCQYKFAYGGSDWLINLAGDKITTKDITGTAYMFQNSKVEYIPFEINLTGNTPISTSMFDGCKYLKEIPQVNITITNAKEMKYIFRDCYCMREIPEWFIDYVEQSYNYGGNNSFFGGPADKVFTGCCSLRKIPDRVMKSLAVNGTIKGNYYTLAYSKPFSNLNCLDELVGISCDDFAFTSNEFSSFFAGLWHVKDVTFETNEDGTPVIRKWKAQVLDFTQNIGWVNGTGNNVKMWQYNSGITADKEVIDDATYQALKDDPDWFTCNVNYSRYNHNSAVNTINSLPDCSASGGVNTIKFYGNAGSLTDGGAINTLTEEEIAVATAKGWTITLS